MIKLKLLHKSKQRSRVYFDPAKKLLCHGPLLVYGRFLMVVNATADGVLRLSYKSRAVRKISDGLGGS